MGFVDSVKAQLRAMPDEPVELRNRPTGAASTRSRDDKDIEDNNEKAMGQVEDQVPQAGVATVEASQALWGNRGRYLILAG